MTAEPTTDQFLVLLKKMGIARSRELERAGVSRTRLRRLVEQGLIDRVGRGLYGLPGAVLTERHQVAEAARRVPGGVVCLLSAVEALRDYRRLHPKHLESLWRFAEADRVTRVLRPYLEAIG